MRSRRRRGGAPATSPSRRSLGIALLYVSAYLLPQLGYARAYFLPDVARQLLFPVVVAVVVLAPASALLQYRLARRLHDPDLPVTLALTVLVLIAVLGAFSAAGYSVIGLVQMRAGGLTNPALSRWVRVVVMLGGAGVIALVLQRQRGRLSALTGVLGLLGYTYTLLAILRLLNYPHLFVPAAQARPPAQAISAAQATPAPIPASALVMPRRRVVWIIFDELDFNLTLGAPLSTTMRAMPNLAALAKAGVSARNAYSPARDTEASLPALLSGYSLAGMHYTEDGALWLRTRHAGTHLFQQSDSVFGRLPGGPGSGALLGYFHPYCHLFPATDPCEALPEANVGRWFDALLFFAQPAIATARFLPGGASIPGSWFREFEPMYRISEQTMREYPRYLGLTDRSLVFMHINLPHPPGDYAQHELGYATVANDRGSYLRNLLLVDRMIGKAMRSLEAHASAADTLLIVSADHWLRINSPRQPQRIPWIAWHVGEASGGHIEQSISTVHTQELVLDFLQRKITAQAEIERWWSSKNFDPVLMPHGVSYEH